MNEREIVDATLNELDKMGFDSFKTLVLITEEEMQSLNIKQGQRRLLQNVVEECKTCM